MIAKADLRKLARGRLRDAKVLFGGNRFDSAFYLCGYAVELALKARICRTLKWSGYPESRKEFEGLQSFKTHELGVLLVLSGREQTVKAAHLPQWSAVVQWSPESRYRPLGSITPAAAQQLIDAAGVLVKKL